MKRKHYPIVTVVVATLLIVVPLLLLSVSLQGFSTDSDITSTQFDNSLSSSTVMDSTASKGTVFARTENKVIAVLEDRPVIPVASLIPQQFAAPIRQQPGQLPSLVPAVEIPSASPLGRDIPKPADAAVSELPEIRLDSEFMTANFPRPEPVVAEIGVVDLPKRPDAGASYYEATGHLALRAQPQVPDPMANHVEPPAPPKVEQAVAEADGATSERSRKSKGRKSKSEEKTSAEAVSDLANSDPGLPVNAPQPGIRAAAVSDALIEEVVIQTPAESSMVSRIENVVAMTRARGWPIALIRSDLPDDVWWVQQVVGIQGNSFAARVNFGNEYSLSGSAFSMVIVFLDSPDEVRRFRIAKQFKDIPEGVRRSREFHYIRK